MNSFNNGDSVGVEALEKVVELYDSGKLRLQALKEVVSEADICKLCLRGAQASLQNRRWRENDKHRKQDGKAAREYAQLHPDSEIAQLLLGKRS